MNKTITIILIIVVVAVAAYFFFGKKKKPEPSTVPDTTPATSNKLGVGESTLSDVEKAKKAQIEGSAKWAAYIRDKAEKAGVPYNEQLIKDVKYCVKSGKC